MRSTILALLFSFTTMTAAQAESPTVDGAWVLSEKWRDFMGLALVIESNTFKYWFKSDVELSEEPIYPITGKVEYHGDTIRLVADKNEVLLYAKNWHLVVHKEEICLLGESHLQDYKSGKRFPVDRLLHKIDDFDEDKPVMNRKVKRE